MTDIKLLYSGVHILNNLDENIISAEYVKMLDGKVMNSIERILKNSPIPEPDML